MSVYIVKLKDNTEIDKLGKHKQSTIDNWKDPTKKDIEEHGDSTTYDYVKYQDWIRQVDAFIKLCPLEFRLDNPGQSYKPLIQLYARKGANYIIEAILNTSETGPIDATKDSIKLSDEADLILHIQISTSLYGSKVENWNTKGEEERVLKSELAQSIKNMRNFYFGKESTVQELNITELQNIKLTDKMSVKEFTEKFKSQLNKCKSVDAIESFQEAKTIWLANITYRRAGVTELRSPINNNDVKAAAKKKNIRDYITEYSTCVMNVYTNGMIPYTEPDPKPKSLTTTLSKNDENTMIQEAHYNAQGRGRGRGGRYRGRNGFRGRNHQQYGHNRNRNNNYQRRDYNQHGHSYGSSTCNNCPYNHPPSREHCPARDKLCNNCGKPGHLEVKCRSAGRNRRGQSYSNGRNNFYNTRRQQSHITNMPGGYNGPNLYNTNFHNSNNGQNNSNGNIMDSNVETWSGFTEESHMTTIEMEKAEDISMDDGYLDEKDELEQLSPFNPDKELFIDEYKHDSVDRNSMVSMTNMTSSKNGIELIGIDTCCSVTQFNDISVFTNLIYDDKAINTSGNVIKSSGKGTAEFLLYDEEDKPIHISINNANYVPGSADLLSWDDLKMQKGFNIDLNDPYTPGYLLYENKRIPLIKKNRIVFAKWRSVGKSNDQAYNTTQNNGNDMVLMHRRLLHAGIDIVENTTGMSHEGELDNCDSCIRAKFVKKKIKVDPSLKEVPVRKREIVQLDFLISDTGAIGGFSQVIIMVDAYSKLINGFLTKDKKYESYIQQLEGIFKKEGYPRMIVVDRDSPFVGKEFTDWCKAHAISLKPVPTARHEFNGLVENAIKTIQSWTTAALLDAQLPPTFWGLASLHAIKIKNRVKHKALDGKPPYEEHYDKGVDLSFCRVFGCLVYYRQTKKVVKFTEKATAGILVGNDFNGTHGTYIIYNPLTRRLSHRYHIDVYFVESTTWKQYQEKLKQSEMKEIPLVVKNYFDTHKDMTEEQKKKHNVIQVAMHTTEEEIELMGEATSHRPKKANPMVMRRKYIKEREKANDDPLSFDDIRGREDESEWLEACNKELKAHEELKTFDIIKRSTVPEHEKIAGCKEVFKTKRDGTKKTRWTFKGNTQVTRLLDDYSSPTINGITFLIMLRIAVTLGWSFASFDIVTAFLNAMLPTGSNIYMELPEAHPKKKDGYIARLNRAIYGMKESGRLFFNLLVEMLKEMNLKQSTYDPCLFYSACCIILVYVDDCLVLGTIGAIEKVLELVKRKMNCTTSEINEPIDFLGCDITWNGDGLEIDQTRYIEKILKRYDMEDAKEYASPMEPSMILYPSNQPVDFPFNKWLGSIMHLRFTRADILFAMNQMCRVMHAPGKDAVDTMKRTFGFIKATKKQKIRMEPCKMEDMKLLVFTDAEWAANKVTRKSTGGELVYFGGVLVSASSKAQSIVAPSTQASELVQMFVAAKKVSWIKAMIAEVNLTRNDYTVPIATDSKMALRAVRMITDKSKHLGVYIAYLRMMVDKKIVSCHKVARDSNPADLMTKQGSVKEFQRLKKMMMSDIRINVVERVEN